MSRRTTRLLYFSGRTLETSMTKVTGVTAEPHGMTAALIVPPPVRILALTAGVTGAHPEMTECERTAYPMTGEVVIAGVTGLQPEMVLTAGAVAHPGMTADPCGVMTTGPPCGVMMIGVL